MRIPSGAVAKPPSFVSKLSRFYPVTWLRGQWAVLAPGERALMLTILTVVAPLWALHPRLGARALTSIITAINRATTYLAGDPE